jgi:TM2 domain-containing membrane protein YozV
MRKYYYSNGVNRVGPVSLGELRSLLDLRPDTLVWYEGLPGWVRAAEVSELSDVFAPVPPPVSSGGWSASSTGVPVSAGYRDLEIKNKGTAYLLFFLSLIGIAGIHRFYLDKAGTGILWLVTWGLFGFGLLYDLFTLGDQVNEYNALQRHAYGNGGNANANNNNIVINVTGPGYPPPSNTNTKY